MFNEEIKLVGEVTTITSYGDQSTTTTERSVFAELKSIGQSEFYQAAAVGLKPEIKFILADYLDYNGEKKIKYKAYNQTSEETYKVLRTYRDSNRIEIVCVRGIDE